MSEDVALEELRRLLARMSFEASHAVARYWWAEAVKIQQATDDPAARWDILVTALRRVGWPDQEQGSEGPERP